MNPVKLHAVQPPTADEKARAEVIAHLEEVLAEARRGEISEVLIISLHPDGEWSNLSTRTESISNWVGYLEQTQFDWMMLAREEKRLDKPKST